MKRLILVGLLVLGCTGGPVSTVYVQVTPEPTDGGIVTETDQPAAVTPKPVGNVSYNAVSARNWKKVLKTPDSYTGQGFLLYACITQFDAATGEDSFRGQAYYKKLGHDDWYLTGANAFFAGDAGQLADFVSGDLVYMKAVGAGSMSYDTQSGGNTTVPLFSVRSITRKGSCYA